MVSPPAQRPLTLGIGGDNEIDGPGGSRGWGHTGEEQSAEIEGLCRIISNVDGCGKNPARAKCYDSTFPVWQEKKIELRLKGTQGVAHLRDFRDGTGYSNVAHRDPVRSFVTTERASFCFACCDRRPSSPAQFHASKSLGFHFALRYQP